MSAEAMSEYFAPNAAANDLVMVFPQAKECWDNILTRYTGENTFTRDGAQMLFMKKIVDRATSD